MLGLKKESRILQAAFLRDKNYDSHAADQADDRKPRRNHSNPPIAVFFSVLGYYLDFRRLYAYGLLYATTEVLWGEFGKSIGAIAQTISGIAILLIGLVVLTRFLRRYPLPVEGTLDVKS